MSAGNKQIQDFIEEVTENGSVQLSEIEALFKKDSNDTIRIIREIQDLQIPIYKPDGTLFEDQVDMTQIDADNVQRFRTDDILSAYIDEIKAYPLLDGPEEWALGYRIRAGKEARERLKKEANTLTPEEKAELKITVEDGEDAREYFINCNLRLAIWWANRYRNRGLPHEDIIQEANRGIIIAVDKFDPDRRLRFSTYASNWIRKKIVRAIQNRGRVVRVPVHISGQITKMRKIERRLELENGVAPTDEEIARELNTTVAKVRDYKLYANDAVSLDIPVGEDENITLGDLISNPNSENAFDAMAKDKFAEDVYELLLDLTPKEYQVITLRFGLYGHEQHTLEEIGNIIGLTRERVRQIEGKALKKLRHPNRASQLREYITS